MMWQVTKKEWDELQAELADCKAQLLAVQKQADCIVIERNRFKAGLEKIRRVVWYKNSPEAVEVHLLTRDALAEGSERKTRCAPQYRISACYFPGVGEAELTWERVSDHKMCVIYVKVTPEQGDELAEVIGPCVYYDADKRSEKEPCSHRWVKDSWSARPYCLNCREEQQDTEKRCDE